MIWYYIDIGMILYINIYILLYISISTHISNCMLCTLFLYILHTIYIYIYLYIHIYIYIYMYSTHMHVYILWPMAASLPLLPFTLTQRQARSGDVEDWRGGGGEAMSGQFPPRPNDFWGNWRLEVPVECSWGYKETSLFFVEDHIWWILMVFWMLWTIPNQKKSAPSLWGENEMKPFKTEPSILEKVQDLEAKPETGMMQSSPSPAISWSKTHWTY